MIGDKTYANILALGDVAETSGPKMARAGMFQADIVCQNILAMIHGREPRAIYTPSEMEGGIKLTLGKVSADRPIEEKGVWADMHVVGEGLCIHGAVQRRRGSV